MTADTKFLLTGGLLLGIVIVWQESPFAALLMLGAALVWVYLVTRDPNGC